MVHQSYITQKRVIEMKVRDKLPIVQLLPKFNFRHVWYFEWPCLSVCLLFVSSYCWVDFPER